MCSKARSGYRTGRQGGPLCGDERFGVGFVSGGEFTGQRGAFPGQPQGNPAFSRGAAKPQVPLLQHGFQRGVGLGRRPAGLGQPPSVCDAVFVHRQIEADALVQYRECQLLVSGRRKKTRLMSSGLTWMYHRRSAFPR